MPDSFGRILQAYIGKYLKENVNQDAYAFLSRFMAFSPKCNFSVLDGIGCSNHGGA